MLGVGERACTPRWRWPGLEQAEKTGAEAGLALAPDP